MQEKEGEEKGDATGDKERKEVPQFTFLVTPLQSLLLYQPNASLMTSSFSFTVM